MFPPTEWGWSAYEKPRPDNCSVWLTGLRGNVFARDILAGIRGLGKVFYIEVKPAIAPSRDSSATLVFFDTAVSQSLIAKGSLIINNDNDIINNGEQQILRVRRSSRQVPQRRTARPEDHSRVLLISGPRNIVNVSFLSSYFFSRFPYEVDEIIPLVEGEVYASYEWRFVCYYGQAESAMWHLIADRSVFADQGVTVRFDRDPCDEWPFGPGIWKV